jgi:hypothetical protein
MNAPEVLAFPLAALPGVDNFGNPGSVLPFGRRGFALEELALGVLQRPKFGDYCLRQRIVEGGRTLGPHFRAEQLNPLWLGALHRGQRGSLSGSSAENSENPREEMWVVDDWLRINACETVESFLPCKGN